MGKKYRPTVRYYAERDTLEHTALSGMFPSIPSLQGTWNPTEDEVSEKNARVRRNGKHQENKSL